MQSQYGYYTSMPLMSAFVTELYQLIDKHPAYIETQTTMHKRTDVDVNLPCSSKRACRQSRTGQTCRTACRAECERSASSRACGRRRPRCRLIPLNIELPVSHKTGAHLLQSFTTPFDPSHTCSNVRPAGCRWD
jgi:hypothetical protein